MDTYSECHRYSVDFERVMELLEDVEFVRFYGSWYEVRLSEVVAN